MASSAKRLSAGVTRVHPLAWIWEPLEAEPSFVLRAMFGAKAVYLGGKLTLCFCASEEPWRGVLVCTEREHHAALVGELPVLVPHPILPKWLYLPEKAPRFETIAARLIQLVKQRDPRIGVTPRPRKRLPGAARRRRPDHP